MQVRKDVKAIMFIQIGNYEINVIFLVLLFILIAAVFGIAYFFIRNKEKGSPAFQIYKRITTWQKNNVPPLVQKDIDQNGDPNEPDDQYHKIADQLQVYIKRGRIWDNSEIKEIDPMAISLLTVIIIEEVERCIEEDSNNSNNRAVLLLHTLDMAYGGAPIINGEIEWLGQDVQELDNHSEMNKCEARLLKIYLNMIEKIWEYVDDDISKIPESANVPEELKIYSADDFVDAYQEVDECVDVKELSESTKRIITLALAMTLEELKNSLDDEGLKYYQLYYIRALACSIDNTYSLYTDILNSIEYK